ncbi:MAG: hypothetical protein JWO93_1469 [Micrococcaceae bacterium]|nr:hypothetical protein [Micrococcaceae bacterium]
MTEQNLPDQDLTIVGEDEAIPDADVDAVSPDLLYSDDSAGDPLDNIPDPQDIDPDLDPQDIAAGALDPVTGDADGLDPLSSEGPDAYPGAAETNPDRWQDDPLLQDEPGAALGGEPGIESDQTLRDDTEEERYLNGDEQVPPEEPTIGEAAEDVDFGDPAGEDEVDGSNDSTNFGGSPLSQFDPDQLDR